MSKPEISPIALPERLEIIDVLRGLAVCGILIGNVQWFSGYGMMPEALAERTPLYSRAIHFLVHFFIEGKFYSVFSFLFGFGFALQMAKAEERGDAKASLFKRRLGWLLVIGLIHGVLVWAGDILSVYAMMGFVLLLFRRRSDESLLRWVAILITLPVVTYIVLFLLFAAFAPADTAAQFSAGQTERWNQSVQTVGEGNFFQILKDYNIGYFIGRWVGLFIQMRLPKILAMFLLGMYAYRKGYFKDLSGNKKLMRQILIYGGILGLIGNVALAALAGNEAPFPPSLGATFGVIGYAFGVPAMALFIVALVALLWQNPTFQRMLVLLAPVGRMALTNYLLQTAICVTIFYGYGFGYFGKIGAARATLIALSIFVVQVILSTLWLRYFAYGPMEWIWRQLTYGRRLDLRVRSQG